ncbi:MAG: ABC transporter permease [Saprospiraceae bacterium]|jgi:lipoprotein-releasing system permease protein|nr:ABC transporter permease [Saprospiraceae bacterium]MBP6569100.1 ABC transporter permease [Saprospiraceae bacterium]
MNIEHFIAKRIAVTNTGSFTKVIIRIAMAAIAVSLTVMILTTAIISGFKQEISDKIFGFWGHFHVTDSNINRNFELIPISKDEKFYDEIRDIKQLEYQAEAKILGFALKDKVVDKKTYSGVKGVHPYIILPGLLSSKRNFHGVLLKGVDEAYDWTKMEAFIKDGKRITYLPDSSSADILVSKNIADKMLISTGDKVVLSFIRDNQQIKKRFQVCGIYNTGLEEYDKRFGIVDIKKLQEILGWNVNEVQGMEVVLNDVRDLDVISEYVYYEILPQQLYAESIRSKFPSIFEWLSLQDINETIILQLMVLVAIINMITVLLILILERTQMIGILKSLGMNNWQVRKIFIYNAGYIIFYGLIIGNILGLGIALLQKHFNFIKLDEANYYLDTAPIEINWMALILLNVGTFVVTLITLVLPTMLITRITPVKALRFD